MITEGQIVLFRFPQADLTAGTLRPALVVRECPGPYSDWLICMISLQIHQEISGIDDIIHATDPVFARTGLKQTSLIRATRLAIVAENMLRGAIGNLDAKRLARIQMRIASWISASPRLNVMSDSFH